MTVVKELERYSYAVYPLISRYWAMRFEEALRVVFGKIGRGY